MEKDNKNIINNKCENKNSDEFFADLGKVKSLYITKFIFSLLSKKKKLNMIIYNKKYQNKFEIKIDYYKKISGKYIIGERNGKGKEYYINTNELIFEGNYFNGKKNGKGTEYYSDGKIKFEGEYSKGIKICGKIYNYDGNVGEIDINGMGKENYNNGKIKFEGEYFNGKRWKGKIYNYNGSEEFEIKYGIGYGKEYNCEGILMFEGNILNGERNGKGKEFNNEGKLIFEGYYLNGKRNGKGKEYYDNELIFEGEYIDGNKIKGKQYLTQEDLFVTKYCIVNKRTKKLKSRLKQTIETYIIQKEKEKEIKKIYDENLFFEGEYCGGLRNGNGKEFFNGILVFEGHYFNGNRLENKDEKEKKIIKRLDSY